MTVTTKDRMIKKIDINYSWPVVHGKEAESQKTYRIRDVKKDGNCFYRVISLAMTGDEENYKSIKSIVKEYLEENEKVWNFLDNRKQLIEQIGKDKCPASQEVIKITAECF